MRHRLAIFAFGAVMLAGCSKPKPTLAPVPKPAVPAAQPPAAQEPCQVVKGMPSYKNKKGERIVVDINTGKRRKVDPNIPICP